MKLHISAFLILATTLVIAPGLVEGREKSVSSAEKLSELGLDQEPSPKIVKNFEGQYRITPSISELDMSTNTLVKNESIQIVLFAKVADPDAKNPRVQVYNPLIGSWLDVAPLHPRISVYVGKTSASFEDYKASFYAKDDGTYTDVGKSWLNPNSSFANPDYRIPSPVQFRILADSRTGQPLGYGSSIFQYGYLDVDLPPDPGPDGKLTLLGIDSNDNGMRDDLERFATFEFAGDDQLRAAAYQFIRALQESATTGDNRGAASRNLQSFRDAVGCIYLASSSQASTVTSRLQNAHTNTADRLLAYYAKNEVLDDTDIGLPDTPMDTNDCDT